MKALVVYESIFGNTKRIALAIADGLRGSVDVEVVEVGEAPKAIDGVDLLVVGGPTHAWAMSRANTREDARKQALRQQITPVSRGIGMREWLQALAPSPGTTVVTFDTVADTTWFPTGSAAKRAADGLRARGHRVGRAVGQFRVNGTPGPLIEGEVDRAKAWGATLPTRPDEAPAPAPRARRAEVDLGPLGHVLAAVVTLIVLAAAHLYGLWGPWLGGLVTSGWNDVLWAVDLSLGVQVVGHALLVVWRPLWLRRLVDVVFTVGSALSLAVAYTVYPFDFGVFDTVARIGLLVVLIVTSIAVVVNLVRLITSPWTHGGAPLAH